MCLVTFSKTPEHSGSKKFINRESDQPVWAYISIIDSCSHNCSWCYGAYNNHDYDVMSEEQFNIITDKLLDIGIKQITFSGGEPTEHPQFLDLVKIANDKGFHIHIATHGEWMNKEMIDKLLVYENVSQVQMNFQGLKRHNQIHGQGHLEQIAAFKLLAKTRIETVATITVGRYNINDIGQIMKEADSLGMTRIRVIDATGRGVKWRKMDLIDLFDTCKAEAQKLGYNYTLSYDPLYKGDVTVPCLQLSNAFMDIDTKGRLQYCGAVLPNIKISNFYDNTPQEILNSYKETNAFYAQEGWKCKAREVTVD